MIGLEIGFLAFGMFLLGALIAGAAFVFYLRWFKKDASFVNQDHLQSGFNTNVI